MADNRKSITTKVEKLRAAFKKDNLICFEDLGCDYLVVDEAHAYKNLAIFSKLNNVAGVNVSLNSQRAFDLEIKICYIQELNNGDLDYLKLPQISGGKPEMIICEPSPSQEEQRDEGMERAKKIESGAVKPEEDNMLAICTFMTKVALDGCILDPEAED